MQNGKLPDIASLKGRCRAALTKKLAIVSQPPTYWIDDSKRNPVTEHLLWAILLVGDPDLFDVIVGIILMEQEEQGKNGVESYIQTGIADLLALAPSVHFRATLQAELALAGYLRKA